MITDQPRPSSHLDTPASPTATRILRLVAPPPESPALAEVGALYELALLYDFTLERCEQLERNSWEFWNDHGQREMLVASEVSPEAVLGLHRQIVRYFLKDERRANR